MGDGFNWRRGRDSNPRYPCEYAAFRVRCFQPLSHLSGAQTGLKRAPNGRALSNQARQDRQGTSGYIAPSSISPATTVETMLNALNLDFRKELHGVFMTLGLLAILTAVLFALVWGIGLAHGSVVFLIPVVIAAARWGIVSAVVAAIGGVLASAFFFYEPLYS